MSLFKKNHMKEMKALQALKNKAAADITAEDLAAVNAELAEAGINAVVLIGSEEHSNLQTAAEELTSLTTRAEEAEASLATAEERITALEAENAELKPAGAAEHSKENGGDKETESDPEKKEDFNAKVQKNVADKYGIDI